jgi:two-component sensor histidine kinase
LADIEQLLVRQRVLADFGEMALRSDLLDEILGEACRLVARAVGADLAKVLEIDPDGLGLLVKAGVGWRPGIVGHERVRMTERSSETFAIEAGRPVISQDIGTETRFEFAKFLKDHGVAALVNVPIFLPGGRPYGLLQVDSRVPRRFDQDDVEFLRTYATILGPVVDRLHKLHSLEIALETNRRLLQELQHRVKNHLATIASMVRLRARQVKTDEARTELTGIEGRIDTVQILHSQLYAAGVTDEVALNAFVKGVAESVCQLHADGRPVRLAFGLAEVRARPEVAVPLGLIVNEFVQNSLRYAFDGTGGTISVTVEAPDGRICIRLSDDGKGLPAEPSRREPGSGTGRELIDGLARQLGGRAVWSSAEPGTSLALDFAR